MRKQVFIKFYLSWNPNYPHPRKEDTSGKCDFCGQEKPRLATLYSAYGKFGDEICETCASCLPPPLIPSLKDFWLWLEQDNKRLDEAYKKRYNSAWEKP